MSAAARIAASPYARRLARERGVPLLSLVGSGPGGRIVASDVPLEAVLQPAPAVEAAPAASARTVAPSRAVAAFAATIDLAPLHAFLVAAGSAGDGVGLDDFLVKAAARAAAEASVEAGPVGWHGPEGIVPVAEAARLVPSRIAVLRNGEATGSARFLVSRLDAAGIRAVNAPLPAEADLRLVVTAGEGATTAEALLVADAGVVEEARAAALLAAFKALLEAPLRLLV